MGRKIWPPDQYKDKYRSRGKAVEKILKTTDANRQYIGWTTTELVRDELGNPFMEETDCRYLSLCVQAANRAVAYWRPDLEPPALLLTVGPFSREFSWEFKGGASHSTPKDPAIVLGTTMLAARWYQRKGGLEFAAFAEFGGPPPAVDKDIEQLLRIGRAKAPAVA